MSELTLVIGTRNLSSWSMRPWLVLKQAAVPFDEIEIALDLPETQARLRASSPSGRVPALKHGKLVIWDSLAICEYLAEIFPQAALWPANREARAIARAVSAEMHSGFQALRQALPMNCTLRTKRPLEAPVRADVDRICALWEDCRARFGEGGPYLFGHFSIADALYAPVVSRFLTYGVTVSASAQAYVQTWQQHRGFVDWMALAERSTGATT